MIFREHTINRSFSGKYKDYKKYKPYLENDFYHRCAYCNLSDKDITTFFEIDHFVPQSEIKKINGFEYLITDYKNLIYSCKLCNQSKSDLFEGNLSSNPYDNARFYDPVKVDYNTIFYRDKYGTISSKDYKGRRSIIDLKLYRPIHNLAWICEQLDYIITVLQEKIEQENNKEKITLLIEARYKALDYYKKCKDLFIASYNKNIKIGDLLKKI